MAIYAMGVIVFLLGVLIFANPDGYFGGGTAGGIGNLTVSSIVFGGLVMAFGIITMAVSLV